MTRDILLRQKDVANATCDWHKAVLDEIKSKLKDEQHFPCLFSRAAFKKNLLRFIFVENWSDYDVLRLADGLSEYVALSREWNGSLNTSYPLIIAFSLDIINNDQLENYQKFGWEVLQKLHNVDSEAWPSDVANDPHDPSWSMCFNGMPLFCNMSHPAHVLRRSRNLGKNFLFIINPRERFDVVAGDNSAGRRIRSNIRQRLDEYDYLSRSPMFGSYGDGSLEWQQYGINEDNSDRSDGLCPFYYNPQKSYID